MRLVASGRCDAAAAVAAEAEDGDIVTSDICGNSLFFCFGAGFVWGGGDGWRWWVAAGRKRGGEKKERNGRINTWC